MNSTLEFYAKDRAAWREWLEKHHESETAVSLIFDKGPGRKLKWEDIVQEALCFGWIGSRQDKISDTQSKIYVSKRKPKGRWSKINKVHIDELVANNLMHPAGIAAVKQAKGNGSWDILNNSDELIKPPELEQASNTNPTAHKNFEAWSDSSKRLILQWIYDAKTDTTRASRITQTVESAELGIKVR